MEGLEFFYFCNQSLLQAALEPDLNYCSILWAYFDFAGFDYGRVQFVFGQFMLLTVAVRRGRILPILH